MYEGEFPLDGDERRIIAGLPIRGAEKIKEYLRLVDEGQKEFRATQEPYWNTIKRRLLIYAGISAASIGTAIATGVRPWALPGAILIGVNLQVALVVSVMFDFKYEKRREIIQKLLENGNKESWYFDSKDLLAQEGLANLWETGSLDAAESWREAHHEMLVHNSDYAAQLLEIDRLLRFETTSEGKLEPVLYVFVRFSKRQPPAPRKPKESKDWAPAINSEVAHSTVYVK